MTTSRLLRAYPTPFVVTSLKSLIETSQSLRPLENVVSVVSVNSFLKLRAGNGWHLAPKGAHICDHGKTASQGQCQAAVSSIATRAGATPKRTLQVGSGGSCRDGGWGQVPVGCSAQSGGDWTPHYKTGTAQANCVHSSYQLVCSGGTGAFLHHMIICHIHTLALFIGR